jgi:hypothetical protein
MLTQALRSAGVTMLSLVLFRQPSLFSFRAPIAATLPSLQVVAAEA